MMADHSSGGDPRRPAPVSRDVVRREFTRQAETFARSLMVADLALEDMLDLADLRGDELMLDLAAGTGAVSFIFAPRVRGVIAADLTTAMLAQAAARAAHEGIENVRLVLADVARLPFTDASFNLATCRIAIHHFSEPVPILQELHRVLRPDARAVICDTLTSEDPTRAALHNRVERIRDPSHVRMLPDPELRAVLASAGFGIETARYTSKTREFGEWTTISQTPPEAAAEARALLQAAIAGDAAGIDARQENGQLCFTHRSATYQLSL